MVIKTVTNADTGTADIVGGDDWDELATLVNNGMRQPYDYLIYKSGSTVKAISGVDGSLFTSNSSGYLDNVIDTILAVGTVSFSVQSGSYGLNPAFDGFLVTDSYSKFVFDPHVTVTIPDGYASYVWKFKPPASAGMAYTNLVGGFWTGGGSVSRNWTFLVLEGSVAAHGVTRCGMRDCVVWGAGIGLYYNSTNSTSYVNGNVSKDVKMYDCVNFIKYAQTSGHIDYNRCEDFDMQTSSFTTAGIVDIDGEGNEHPGCILWDINNGASGASTPSSNIKATATYTGVTKTMSTQAFTDLGTGTFIYQDAASRTKPNVFTDTQYISKDTQDLAVLYRPVNTVGSSGRAALRFDHKNSSSAQTAYAYLIDEIVSNTAGAEESKLSVWVKNAGSAGKVWEVDKTGILSPTINTPLMKYTHVSKTNSDSPYSIATTDDKIRLDATSGAIIATLPTAVNVAGKTYTIRRTDVLSSTNIVTIATTSSQTIGGAPNEYLSPAETIVVESDGTNWQVIARTNPNMMNYYVPKNSTNNRRIPAGTMGLSVSTAASTTSPAANTLWALPFLVPKTTKFDTISFDVTTLAAGKFARAGIYRDNGNCYPGVLVFDTGTIDVGASSGVKDTTITAGLQVFSPGLYWLTWETDAGATLQILTFTGVGQLWGLLGIPGAMNQVAAYGYSVAHTYGALPDPYTASASLLTATPAVGAPIPYICLRPI